MIDLEKNRIQTEVMAKIEDFKQMGSENNSEQKKESFLKKFLRPYELFNNTVAEKKVKILYCEDCQSLGKIIRRMIESKGYDVTISENPIPYLNREQLRQFDFIITDNNMPYMTGTQFTEYVERELQMDIPMYIYTGDSYLKDELPTTKVRRGIFNKGFGFEKTFQAILTDFEKYREDLNNKIELKFAATANSLVC